MKKMISTFAIFAVVVNVFSFSQSINVKASGLDANYGRYTEIEGETTKVTMQMSDNDNTSEYSAKKGTISIPNYVTVVITPESKSYSIKVYNIGVDTIDNISLNANVKKNNGAHLASDSKTFKKVKPGVVTWKWKLNKGATVQKVKNGEIQKGDIVYLHYFATNSQGMTEETDCDIIVGEGEFDLQFENELIGKEVNKKHSFSLLFEDTCPYEPWRGEKIEFSFSEVLEGFGVTEKYLYETAEYNEACAEICQYIIQEENLLPSAREMKRLKQMCVEEYGYDTIKQYIDDNGERDLYETIYNEIGLNYIYEHIIFDNGGKT